MSLNLESNKEQIKINEVKLPVSLIYEFGNFSLDAEFLMLSRGGEEIALTPKVVETLLALVERHGEIISKDELMDRVWENAFVEESNLVQNIYVLRKALGETGDGLQIIETLRRRGYRFNGEVTVTAKERPPSLDPQTNLESDSETVQTSSGEFDGSVRKGKWFFAAIIVIGFLLLLGGLRSTLFHDPSKAAPAPAAAVAFKRLTPDTYTRSPVLSADGRFLAYSQIDHNKESVWLKDLGGDTPVQLLPPLDLDAGYNVMHFSPDGRQLFYSTHLPNSLNNTIFRLTLGNREQIKIAEDDISPSTISPDGLQIAFINSKYEMMTVNSDGSGNENILRKPVENEWVVAWNSEMSWSPDGTRIALCSGHNDGGRSIGNLVEFNVKSRDERRISLPDNLEWIDDAIWMPDGKSLLITARRTQAEHFQIYRLSTEDGTASRITNDDHDYRWMSFSPAAGLLVAEQGTGHYNIWTAPLSDPKNLSQATFGNVAEDGFDGIAFMPDGSIVYTATRSGSVDLWIMNADGSDPRQLTTNAGTWNARPRVTPDGRSIVFSSSRTGTTQLWKMNADGSNPIQLTNSLDPAYRATIAPDGNSVYYNTEYDGSVWRIGIGGGEPLLVSKQKCIFPSISPDGKMIACVEVESGQSNSWHIEVLAAGSGELIKTYDYPAGRNLLVWSPDSRSVMSMNSNWSNVTEHPLDNRPEHRLTDFAADRLPFFAISPDYKKIAFSRGTSFSETVQILGPIDASR